MMLCVLSWTTHSQTHKDLNSPERVKALYEITMQHKELTKQVASCKDKYNEDMANYEKSFKQIQSLAVALGEESSAFVSHNLDLQAGLLGLIEENKEQEVELATLKAKRKKRFSIGPYLGYDFFQSKASGGVGIQYTIIAF